MTSTVRLKRAPVSGRLAGFLTLPFGPDLIAPRASLVALDYGPGAAWGDAATVSHRYRVVYQVPATLERSRRAIELGGHPVAYRDPHGEWHGWAAPTFRRGRPATSAPLRELGGKRRLDRVRLWWDGREDSERDAPAVVAVEVDAAAWRACGGYVRARLLRMLGRRWASRCGWLRAVGVPRATALEARDWAHLQGMSLVLLRRIAAVAST